MARAFDPYSLLLAIITSSSAIFLLAYGLGIGSSLTTAVLLSGSIAALFALGDRRSFVFVEIDALFLAFVICIGISFALNGWPPEKDTVLLSLSLAAYPAGRTIPRAEIGLSFIGVSAAVVLIGGIATAYALVDQWGPLMHRPEVFGYSHAGSVFLMSLGFILIALTSGPWLNDIRTRIVCGVLSVPAFIFGVSLVRFGFAAIVAALAAVAATCETQNHRRRVYIIIAAIVVVMVAGLLTRHKTIELLLSYKDPVIADPAIATEQSAAAPSDPLIRCGIHINSSISIRKVLLRDALAAIPGAGWFGIGFTNFGKVTCFSEMYPHNSILQALVEFGWLGGAALMLMMLVTLLCAWGAALHSDEARFVFASFVYVAVLGLAHGSLCHDYLLFLFMGYAGRLYQDGFWVR
jgi:O-antigen ligase